MDANDTSFSGSIPEIYDEYLVPLVFEPYAEDVAARLRDLERGTLLETAAGTGAVTRALSRSLAPEVRIVATDLNEAMIAVSARHGKASSVRFQQADAQKLPFGDAEFDAVVCQFGMMFLPDRPAGYREARRVLRPSGRFVFSVWDRLANNEVSLAVHHAIADLFPTDPPRFVERMPFGYHDVERIQGELEAAGFRHVVVDVVDKTTRVASPRHVAVGLCQGTPLRGEIEARNADLADITAKVTDALAARFGTSSFDNRMRALVVTASS